MVVLGSVWKVLVCAGVSKPVGESRFLGALGGYSLWVFALCGTGLLVIVLGWFGVENVCLGGPRARLYNGISSAPPSKFACLSDIPKVLAAWKD